MTKDNIVDNYLEYLNEVSKWKEKVNSGELSQSSINKLKDKGVIKPEKKFLKGVRQGTKKILKKHKTTTSYSKIAGIVGPATNGSANSIMQDAGNSKWFRFLAKLKGLNLSPREWAKLKPMIDRHEANEIVAFVKQGIQDKKTAQAAIQFMHNNKLVGSHYSPKVLSKEKDLVNYQNKVYPNKALDKWTNFRTKSGEYGLVSKNKKELKQIGKKLLDLRRERQKLLEKASETGSNILDKKGILNKLKDLWKERKVLLKAASVLKGVKLAI